MDHGLKDVRHWLASFQLQDYVISFMDNGFTSLQKCCFLTESHLNQIRIPTTFHYALLQSVKNLQIKYPDYNKLLPEIANDDVPPPLPEKKIRKSLPSPRSLYREEHHAVKSSSLPPSAPPRTSVLRRSTGLELQAYDTSISHNTENLLDFPILDTLPPPPPFINPDLVDIFPPPPEPVNFQTESDQEKSNITQDIVKITLNDVVQQNKSEKNLSKRVKPPVKPRPVLSPKPSAVTPICQTMSSYEDLFIPPKMAASTNDLSSRERTGSNTLPSKLFLNFDEVKAPQTSSTLPYTRVSNTIQFYVALLIYL